MMWTGTQFLGAKIALLLGDVLLAYRRDDRPDIPFPNMWDLPGGGREGDESPVECALRELMEEFGIALAPARISWIRSYERLADPAGMSYFLVAPLTAEDVATTASAVRDKTGS